MKRYLGDGAYADFDGPVCDCPGECQGTHGKTVYAEPFGYGEPENGEGECQRPLNL